MAEQRATTDDKKADALKKSLSECIAQGEAALSERPDDPCLACVLIALKDTDVQDHFVKHLLNNEAFTRAYCLGGVSIPEVQRVVFEFTCVLPKICLFPMRFMVTVNVITGKVEEIADPAPTFVPVSEQMPGVAFQLP